MGNWTAEEINILKKKYPSQGRSISELLINHTYRSVSMKASSLKIKHNGVSLWTKDEEELLKKKYSINGSNIPSLLFNHHSKVAITAKARRLKLHWSHYEKWTNEETKFLIENVKIMTTIEIAKKLNKKIDGVRNKIVGLKIKTGYRKTVNEDFFKKWSKDMAYVLGLWFADGNLDKNLDRFSICSIDIEILIKIKKIMESEHPIRLNKKGNRTHILAINRKEMCRDLLTLGGVPCKSLIAEFPQIPEKYIHHFIRGNFDGDGCISFGYKGYPKISFLGTHHFLKGVLNAVGVEGEIKKARECRVHYLLFSGIKAQRVLKYMYGQSNLYIERKYKRYQTAMTWRPRI
jgi:hypothetical protein